MSARLVFAAALIALSLAPAPALAGPRRITAPAYPQVPAGILGIEDPLSFEAASACRCQEGHIYLSFRDAAGRRIAVELRRRDGRLLLRRDGAEALTIAPGSAEEAALYRLIRPETCLHSGLRSDILGLMEAHARALSPERLQALARIRLR